LTFEEGLKSHWFSYLQRTLTFNWAQAGKPVRPQTETWHKRLY
jgi:hypothetical protein